MNDARFDALAERTLLALVTALDAVDGVEAELSQGVLSISFDAGGAPFVVNSHRAARQIWMAADRTAFHFDPDAEGGRWTTAKEPVAELWGTLGASLSRRLGRAVDLR